jgi:hypothetical protein
VILPRLQTTERWLRAVEARVAQGREEAERRRGAGEAEVPPELGRIRSRPEGLRARSDAE